MFGLKKLLNVSQTKAADRNAIECQGIPSIELMEQASNAFVNALLDQGLPLKKIAVVCGVGNNGGDGLAVARILQQQGFEVQVFLVKFKAELSPDCAANLARLEAVETILPETPFPDLSEYDVTIDALLGSGLTKKLSGFLKELVEFINQTARCIYSIDIPSGLFSDKLIPEAIAIKADYCISFQRPKLAFFYAENNTYIEDWTYVDIGLDENFIQQQESSNFILDEVIGKLVQKRTKHSHKGTYGHALIIAGSYGKIGAATLAAKACLRSGVGLLTAYVPKCGYQILQSAVPESMCLTDKNEDFITQAPSLEKYHAVGVGPGIGTSSKTADAIYKVLAETKQGLVLDADAINLIAKDEKLLSQLPKNCILTPHPKEFERLVGKSSNSSERLAQQLSFSKAHHCIVVLKGANTSISSPEGKLFFNTSGNPGMASGGSGDVLTGVITGLLAQGYEPLLAALIGVYFHGKAGDAAVQDKGENALLASDIITAIRIENFR